MSPVTPITQEPTGNGNLDLGKRGEEKTTHAVFQSETLALPGHPSHLLAKVQIGSYSLSENE